MPRLVPPWASLFVLLVVLAALAAVPSRASAHRRIFVWFADSGLMPASGTSICRGRPPAFDCTFGGSVDDCRRQVIMWLDRWYADFDVSFTFAPPAAGAGKYDTVLVSHNGAWCGAEPVVTSRSPLPGCTDVSPAALAVFKCDEPRRCATLIAKEHGHIVGLQHTSSSTDVMFDEGGADHDGFEDSDNRPTTGKCGTTQNSYRLMLARLGTWPGGPKPAPDPPLPPTFPDGGAPEDAATPDSEPPADAGPDIAPGGRGEDPPAGGGCRLAPAGARTGSTLALALPGLAALLLRRRRYSPR